MRVLNTPLLTSAMESAGLSQADLAKSLGVSREAVSKWLKGVVAPRPDKLLRLGMLVKLRANELLLRDSALIPVVAFRKRGSAKTTIVHIERAQDMGALLRPLVDHLPFDKFVRPETLKSPSNEYAYVQELVSKIRDEMGVADTDTIEFTHLVKRFANTQTVLIPVLWGKKGNHENALHIFLPDSLTTWVYLNLDVEVHDFKFWMAHELGHVLAPDLRGDEAEDFADNFAGALLMPESVAREAYSEVAAQPDDARKINTIKAIAERHLISPNTVYVQMNAFATAHGKQELVLTPAIYGACKNLSKKYYSVSESLFGTDDVKPSELIEFATNQLDSPFYPAITSYLRKSKNGPGYIQSVLNMPALDAVELHKTLV